MRSIISMLALTAFAACTALAADFSPISDARASAWYRIRTAQALLRKFHAGAGSRALLEVTP